MKARTIGEGEGAMQAVVDPNLCVPVYHSIEDYYTKQHSFSQLGLYLEASNLQSSVWAMLLFNGGRFTFCGASHVCM